MVKGRNIVFAALTAAILLLTACNRDKDNPRSGLSVSGSIRETATKVTVSDGVDRIVSQWEVGDVIKGFWIDGEAVTPLSYKVSSINEKGRASFTLVSGNEPTVQGTAVHMVYSSGNCCSGFDESGKATVDISVQDGTFEGLEDRIIFCATAEVKNSTLDFSFGNLTSIIELKSIAGISQDEKVFAINFTAPGIGRAEISLSDGGLTLTPSGDLSRISAEFPEGISSTTTIWMMAVPVENMTATVLTDGDSYRKDVVKTLEAGVCHSVKKLSVAPDERFLSGLFTIDEEGRKVRFSKGNLRATRAGGHVSRLDFAPHQYDFLADAAKPMTVSSDGTFDLFGWSTPISDFGLLSDGNYNYSGDFLDWGSFVAAGCRTLSEEELNYIIDSGNYLQGYVQDVFGIFLLPDEYNSSFEPYSDITLEEFITLEDKGLVFLPAAAFRNGSAISVAAIGSEGAYWTSSGDIYGETAASLYFSDGGDLETSEEYRYAGNSVRLVVDVK